MNRLIVLTLLALLVFVTPGQSWYPRLKQEMIVTPETTIVGHNRTYIPAPQETLVELAMRAGLGFDNLMQANPGVDPWSPPPGGEIVLPSAVLLPSDIWTGITINLAELRLYLMWDDGGVRKVRIYPVGIGREDWATPLGDFHVKVIIDNPDWTPPASVREEKPELPGTVPPGPDNPLGNYWIGLSAEGVGIHGNNQPFGVGRRVSHGCIRLYRQDIADLVKHVGSGTRVRIIDQPVKHLVREERLYLEVHRSVDNVAALNFPVEYWNAEEIARILREARGLPVEITRRENLLLSH